MDVLIWIVGAFALGAFFLSLLIWQRLAALSSTLDEGPRLLRELAPRLEALHTTLQGLDQTLRTEQRETRSELSTALTAQRTQAATDAATTRDELRKALNDFSASLKESVKDLNELLRTRLGDLGTQQNQVSIQTLEQLEKNRATLEQRLTAIQQQNEVKLDEMRKTVDEKLQSTLEKRLGESFKLVSDRLEAVHQGLGDMKNLATGVGDLKRVLSNVKTRGILGEYQLANLITDLLTPEQYVVNAKTKPGSNNVVEFAVRLPQCMLPIDSKFPTEDYQRLLEALDLGEPDAIDTARKALAVAIRKAGQDIRDKYLDPPHTTDFGILFLPFEGLYAEVIRIPGLFDSLRQEQRVVLTGPTTLSAVLSSLQMGFKTLAIEKRSSEVWELLGAIKTEFSTFGDLLAKTKKKMTETASVIGQAEVRSRAIERKLKNVQQLPASQSQLLLGTLADTEEVEPEGE